MGTVLLVTNAYELQLPQNRKSYLCMIRGTRLLFIIIIIILVFRFHCEKINM